VKATTSHLQDVGLVIDHNRSTKNQCVACIQQNKRQYSTIFGEVYPQLTKPLAENWQNTMLEGHCFIRIDCWIQKSIEFSLILLEIEVYRHNHEAANSMHGT
jgi:hypothetical protein